MLMSSSGRTGSSPSVISLERRIMPAHVPKIGAPRRARSRIGWRSPQLSMSLRIAVLSPPGRISPDRPSRSLGSLTGTASTPMSRSNAMCSANAPCTASTPMRTGCVALTGLPAANRQPLSLGNGLHLDALHGAAEALGDVGDDARVVEVGGRLDDRPGKARRIVALEDATADEHALGTQLHRERRVGRGRDATGDEIDDRQLAVAGHILDELERRAQFLGGDEQFVWAHALQ